MWKVFSGEVRYAVRTLARAPRFTVVAAFTLALGIGATSSIFSAVNGVLLQPLPYPDSDRIVGLWHGAPDLGYDQFGTSPGIFHQYQSENQVYEAMGLYLALERNLTEEGDAERVPATASTHGLFEVLGVQPMLGRTYTAEEATEGGPSVVVLSHGLWQRRFGGTPDILGRTMQVDGYPNEIIGVMPPGFDFGGVDRKSDLWLPLHVDLENGQPGTFSYQGVARLRPGVTPEVAVAQETALLERVRERWADAEAFINFLDAGGFHPIVHGLKEEVVGDMERPLWILLGTVGFVLLIACGNVANLFLVRAEGRQREMAVRAAMGAGRGRITGQFLAESLVLAGMGGVAGLAVAWWGTPLLLRMAPPELPRLDQISMDGSVLLFTLGVTALAALLFGMVPALRYDVPGLLGVLRYAGRGTTEGRERHHLRNALVVGQTALAMVLLVGSGLRSRLRHRGDPHLPPLPPGHRIPGCPAARRLPSGIVGSPPGSPGGGGGWRGQPDPPGSEYLRDRPRDRGHPHGFRGAAPHVLVQIRHAGLLRGHGDLGGGGSGIRAGRPRREPREYHREPGPG
jgi:predicted permease